MATLTEIRVKGLQENVRNARLAMQGAEESLQYALAVKDGSTVNCSSPLGNFDMPKEQLVSAAEKTFAENKAKYRALCKRVEEFLDSEGIE